MRKTTLQLQAQKGRQPIVMVTAYDATMAALVDEAVDCILVGDSLGMVVQGHQTTVPVTMDEMVYHTRMVTRGTSQALILADMPFLSYQASVEDAVRNAGRLFKEGGAQAVKMEGGLAIVPQVRAVVAAGMSVVCHIGLTPQSIHQLGGYGKQGQGEAAAARMLEEALALEAAGGSMVVLEVIPHGLAARLTTALTTMATIGIGAGRDCDGQVQVFHDLLGLIPDFKPRHSVQYLEGGRLFREAISKYAAEVRSGDFLSE